jgi:hypothetical protein
VKKAKTAKYAIKTAHCDNLNAQNSDKKPANQAKNSPTNYQSKPINKPLTTRITRKYPTTKLKTEITSEP